MSNVIAVIPNVFGVNWDSKEAWVLASELAKEQDLILEALLIKFSLNIKSTKED